MPENRSQQEDSILEKILCAIEDGNKQAHKDANRIIDELDEIFSILQQIADNTAPAPTLTASVANVFTGASKMADNVLVMNIGDVYTDTITPRQADGVTASGGVLSAVVITYTDLSATFVLNADNTVTFTAVSTTAAPVSGSTACTVTDTDGAVSTWTIPFTVNAAVVPPTQLTQSVANVFTKVSPLP
jgi:hypothetical protein